MTEVRTLEKADLDELYKKFPNGRPLDFATPAAPNGFSLVAVFSNFFEKIGLCEKTPSWVREKSRQVREEKMEDGSLTGTVTMRFHPAIEEEFPNKGSLVRIKADGKTRFAMLLDLRKGAPPRGWIIAAWNAESGEECAFPT